MYTDIALDTASVAELMLMVQEWPGNTHIALTTFRYPGRYEYCPRLGQLYSV